MNPTRKPQVGLIAVGDAEVEEQKRDCEALIEGIRGFDVDIEGIRGFDVEPISKGIKANAGQIELAVEDLSSHALDVLVIAVLRGAQAIQRAAESIDCPCIIRVVKERWAWPSSALALGALKEKREKVRLVYGSDDDKDVLNEFRESLRAAFALSRLRRSRFGVIGSLFPNLVSRNYDKTRIKVRLGIEIVKISFEEVRQEISAVSEDVHAIESLRRNIHDRFTVEAAESVLTPGIKLHLALKRIAKKHGLDGFAIECWTGMPEEIGLNPCLGFVEDDYTIACEGDVLTCIAAHTIRYLTGINPYTGDVYDLDNENILTLVHCGAPASLAHDPKSVTISESVQAGERGFPTAVCRPHIENGDVTVLSLYGKGCDYVHLSTGEWIETRRDEKMWVKIRLAGERRAFLEACLANHYVVVPGNVLKELELLCEWLDIGIVKT
ncbi:MAG: hypothetical protein B1H02_06275 [Candidatus Latescibacteria bacterium 4484_107]|nr:MAG: hypothetical protein B1H02_06275 [Candidatus Latescibacteria bacterium 4484_107]